MTRWPLGPPAPGLSRREFLGLASAAVGLWIPRARGDEANALASRSPSDREHLPLLRLPAAIRDGAKVPIAIELDHPMSPTHYITTVQVVNPRDPVPSKGTFHFTPANGRVDFAFQARMHQGASVLAVSAECNRHGRRSVRRAIVIPEHAGG